MSRGEVWDRVLSGVTELSGTFGSRLVFIGGVAVFLHLLASGEEGGLAEVSHDGDFLVSMADFADLRDMEEVSANSRLHKYQLIKYGVEFDVYVEHRYHLAIPFDEAFYASRIIEGVRVAGLEHLLVLKLHAYEGRRGTAKGGKDERDVIRIVYLLGRYPMNVSLLTGHWMHSMTEVLVHIAKSSQFLKLTMGNAHRARKLRESYLEALERLGIAAKKRDPEGSKRRRRR